MDRRIVASVGKRLYPSRIDGGVRQIQHHRQGEWLSEEVPATEVVVDIRGRLFAETVGSDDFTLEYPCYSFAPRE